MKIDIQPARYEEKHLLKKMLELYAYDCSEFEDADLNEFGEYGYRYLACIIHERIEKKSESLIQSQT